jgi:hypothetical protein
MLMRVRVGVRVKENASNARGGMPVTHTRPHMRHAHSHATVATNSLVQADVDATMHQGHSNTPL